MNADATSLHGRTALVTGAAGGIGEATVRLFVRRGARVVIADRDYEKARELAERLGEAATAIHLELSDPSSIEQLVKFTLAWSGGLDIVHNNAALLDPKLATLDRDVETMDLELWDATFSVNVRGAMLVCRAALPHLSARGNGAIVNTVSNLALQGHAIQAAYSASKAALIQLTRSIAVSHARRGVRCNAVAPGMTLTEGLKRAFPAHLRRPIEDETLRDRLGAPEDIAEAVAFLASDAALNVTGQVLVCDGGLSMHVPGFAHFIPAEGTA